MPGYAAPIDNVVSTGSPKSVSFTVSQTTAPTAFYTATTKTKVSSVLAHNTLGTILPVKLYVYRDSNDTLYPVAEIRVLNHKYLVQQLVSGDLRVDDKEDQFLDRYKVASDFVLNAGDQLRATCPIANAIVLTVSLEEGI